MRPKGGIRVRAPILRPERSLPSEEEEGGEVRGGRGRKGNGESFRGSISEETLFVGIEWAEVVVDRDLWLQRRGMRYRPPQETRKREGCS